jgi:hypothetical protein
MMYPSTTIKFQPLPLNAGMEWHVVVTYPSGHKERIAGFKNQLEAVNWIGSLPCMQWLNEWLPMTHPKRPKDPTSSLIDHQYSDG